MDEPGVPDLEEMNEQQAQQFLTEMFTHLSPEAEYEIRHEDYVMEMPQSGERIRGREKMRELQQSFPDYRFDIEDAASGGETVALRGTITGTHQGEL